MMNDKISRCFRDLVIFIYSTFLGICVACQDQAVPTLQLQDQDLQQLKDQSQSKQSILDQSFSDFQSSNQAFSDQAFSDQAFSDQAFSDQAFSDQAFSDQMLADQATSNIDPVFNEVFLKATHNSYSGDLLGQRGTILTQLNAGIRFIEFDVHDQDFVRQGDYRIGHTMPNDEVDHMPNNPQVTNLTNWLNQINQWSLNHPGHAPIVVLLDLKDSLTDQINEASGNLSRLNRLIKEVFEDRLLPAYRANPPQSDWPRISTLRSKIITVLSGDLSNRTAYYQDQGASPAIAINQSGQVIEVHDSGDGKLWYWSGKIVDQNDGTKTIHWLDHGRYQNGQKPAVLIDEEGNLIEVHQSEANTTIWAMTGKINDQGIVTWQANAQRYDDGIKPTLGWENGVLNGVIREVHQSQNREARFSRTGRLVNGQMVWRNDNAQTALPFYDKNSSGGYHVSTSAAQGINFGVLYWRRANQALNRIRYEPILFLEFQDQNPAELLSESHFFGATRSNVAFLQRYRHLGIVRLWQYMVPANRTPRMPLSQYAQIMATDTPYLDDYVTWMQNLGAIE